MKDFYGKKVLVTGHTGFKGAWLSKILSVYGAQVVGISDKVEDYHLCYKNLSKNIFCNEIFQKVENVDFSSIIKKEKIEVVFYLAAQAFVPRAFAFPHNTIISNVVGASNFLENLIHLESNLVVVFVTSDKVYENNEWVYGYRENDKLGGVDPYSASKTATEIIIRSYRECFLKKKSNISLGIARAGNVIGGGDFSPGRIIPDAIRALENNDSLAVKNPKATRPWQHVIEPLHGYIKLAQRLKLNKLDGEAFNFGPTLTDNIPVFELLKILQDNLPNLNFHSDILGSKIIEHKLLYLDSSKAQQILNWKTMMNIETSVSWVADWYRKYLEEPSLLEETMENQIEKYWGLE